MYGSRSRVGIVNPSRGDVLIYEYCKAGPDGVLVELAKKNDKVRGVDVTKLLDASFVQSAAAGGLDKATQ